MQPLSALLAEPLSPEQFHRRVRQRLAPRLREIDAQARLVRERLPDRVQATTVSAERALKGEMILPGTGGKMVFIGDPPKWLHNPTADDEYIWGLNRMYQWEPLFTAYTLTGDDRYARKVADELRDWIATCPCPPIDAQREAAFHSFYSGTPWRSLEAGIRMFDSWSFLLEHLVGSEWMTPELLALTAGSMHEHARVLAEICPIFWPRADHNHYLMEMLGLLAVATTFPEFAASPGWLDQSMRDLERCAMAQLTTEGGQIEGCPSYHNGCAYWFGLAPQLGARVGRSFSSAYHQRVRRAFDYSLHAFRPSGTGVPWGDSDADLSAIRAALWAFLAFGDDKALRVLCSLVGVNVVTSNCMIDVWRIPNLDDLLKQLQPAVPSDLPRVNWQRELKQVAMRTSWDRDALSVFFACRSPVNNGHAHLDPMSFDFTALGQAMLVDPGRFTYVDAQPRRDFKSTAYHNAVTVDDKQPFDYAGTWKFTPQKLGEITGVYEAPNVLTAAARQFNFEPAIHRRLVAILDSRFLLVIDALTHLTPDQSVQIWYHFDSIDVSWDDAHGRATATFGNTSAALYATPGVHGWVLDGRVSPVLDVAHQSKRLRLEAKGGLAERLYATLIVPFVKGQREPKVSELTIHADAGGYLCSFTVDGERRAYCWSEDAFQQI